MRVYDVLSSKSVKTGLSFADEAASFYTVTANVMMNAQGSVTHFNCTCPGFTYRQHCRHVDLIRQIEQDPDLLEVHPEVRLRIGSFDLREKTNQNLAVAFDAGISLEDLLGD